MDYSKYPEDYDALAEFEKRRHMPATEEDIDALAERIRHLVWGACSPLDQELSDELLDIAILIEELKLRIPGL
jgi:hypothetical protein